MSVKPTFRWDEPIDDKMQHLNVPTIKRLCEALPTFGSTRGWSRKGLYDFIADQDSSNQKLVYDKALGLLAEAGKACKRGWVRKRRAEDEEANLRVVKAKVDQLKEKLSLEKGKLIV